MKNIFALLLALFLISSVGSAASFDIEMSAGWNLVSAPFAGVGKAEVVENCEWEGGPWWWGPEEDDWVFHEEMSPQKGYWVKVADDCSFSIEGSPAEQGPESLKDGWNLVSSTQGNIGKKNVQAACNWNGGPWWWGPGENDWVFEQTMDSTRGYWIKVSDSCVVSDKNVEAEADWDFLVAEEGDEKLTGLFEVGNMDLTSVEGIDRVDRYRIDVDFKDDGDFERRDAGLIKRESTGPDRFDPTFENTEGSESGTSDRMLIPLDYSDIQPWREPVRIRLTVVESMLIRFPDRDVYRFIEAGDNKSFPAGDKDAGCREESGDLVCRDMGLTTDAEFSCDDEEYQVGVSNVEPDESRARFFYRPTTTWKTIDTGDSRIFSDSDGNPVFSVSVQDTDNERGWKVTDFTVTCE